MSGILERLSAMLRPVNKIQVTETVEVHPHQELITRLESLVRDVCVSAVSQSVVGKMVLARVYYPSVHELVTAVYLTTPDTRDHRVYAVSLGRYFTGSIQAEESLQRLINGVKETKSLSGKVRHDINTIIEVLRENQ